MIYLTRFALPSAGAELHFLSDSRENKRTCYTSRYPFGVFFNREVPTLELEPVTILCGGNGSGKTTILNLMGEKLGLRRGTVFNRSSFLATTWRCAERRPLPPSGTSGSAAGLSPATTCSTTCWTCGT